MRHYSKRSVDFWTFYDNYSYVADDIMYGSGRLWPRIGRF